MFERDYNEKYNFYKSDFQNECDYLDFDSFSSFIFMRENKLFNDGNNIPFEPNYLNTKINDTTDILKTKESGKELSDKNYNGRSNLFFSELINYLDEEKQTGIIGAFAIFAKYFAPSCNFKDGPLGPSGHITIQRCSWFKTRTPSRRTDTAPDEVLPYMAVAPNNR